ncbi:MAG: Mrp/NBP35 family ATP-binding protein [Bacteroidetes bacterium]|uniref:Iron-sulfur cluster carrier protein n=1 Tax=Candidatus Merdivivens pullicola TaxID=2840872 RepID=A0A9D9NGT8_9BACT|nr:Mrp/NBP35 family ATP-binding protein [Candidatus Merdivivens pullicola]
MITQEQILLALREVEHPAKDRDILSLGIVEGVDITDDKVTITLGFQGRDPLTDYLIAACKSAVKRVAPQCETEVRTILKERKPTKKQTGLELGMDEIEHIGKIVAVSSGKGGVGKSTVAVNLAIALARLGYKVGLADADVYGPSVPKMTGTEGMIPDSEDELILPIEKYGVKWMSIGYFAQPGQALIWRGPMACNALKQLILQVRWGELDFLLIDLPPGTGDIHISLVHDIPLSGAIIVTTPQDVALSDAEKGVNMFRNENIRKPIYGLVENMAWFTPAELPENRYYIFGKDGGKKMADQYGIDLLGQIPIVQSIREGGDAGTPAALNDGPDGKAFLDLGKKLLDKCGY